jgi:hypothetical protein
MTALGRAHDANLPSGVLPMKVTRAWIEAVRQPGSRHAPATRGSWGRRRGTTTEETHVDGQDGHPGNGDGTPQRARDLEARVTELEQRVVTLAAAVDAASRMRVATPFRVNEDIRIAGGRLVRRILEKGSLVADYRGAGRTE